MVFGQHGAPRVQQIGQVNSQNTQKQDIIKEGMTALQRMHSFNSNKPNSEKSNALGSALLI